MPLVVDVTPLVYPVFKLCYRCVTLGNLKFKKISSMD